MRIVLNSIVGNIGGGGDLYDHVMNTRISTSIIKLYIHMKSKIHEESGHNFDVDLLTISF
jgi:hypothetical protein